MAKMALNWFDRLRIERTVWTLDTYLQSLPGRSRRTIRREIRTNLRVAAAEVGSARAIHRLGNLRRLAADYLEGEYGEGRARPSWLKALFWVLSAEMVLLALAFASHSAFIAGVEATDPHPDGTYTWHSMEWLGVTGDVRYAGGDPAGFSISLSASMLLYLLLALVLGGRLWRLPAAWWRARQRDRQLADAR
jgi:hypothetical protein